MNILYINHYAGSPRHGMEYRPYYLAREWVRNGHKVKIIASAQSHVRAKQPNLNRADRLDEGIDGIQYTWLKTTDYSGNGIKRVINMFSFIYWLYRIGRQLASDFKPDVVIASSTYPMDIWPARRIAKLANAKLVFEVHDLWPLSPMELGGMSKWHPFIMLVQAAENYAYRNANIVVSMLPKVRDHMESHGLLPSKLHIVPNGIDPDEWSDEGHALPSKISDKLSKIKSTGNTIVGYAGSHGVANALDTLLDAAQFMQNEKVIFVLVGGGPEKDTLLQRVQKEGLKNIAFIDPVLKEQIPTLLKWFDIAYIGWHRNPLYRFGISPNKLMDYMMASKSIIHAVEAGNDPVNEVGCGFTVAPDNLKEICNAILKLSAMSSNEREIMGGRGKHFVLAEQTYTVLAMRFINAIGN